MSASNPIPPARAWADIDLGALVANARTVLSVSGSRLLPMVKANAYGIGAAEATRALEAVGLPYAVDAGGGAEGPACRGVIGACTVAEPASGEGGVITTGVCPMCPFASAPFAAEAFFRGLKDEVHDAVETLGACQVVRRAEQHRRVAVVPAGVHHAVFRRLVGEGVGFDDGQGVHVRP